MTRHVDVLFASLCAKARLARGRPFSEKVKLFKPQRRQRGITNGEYAASRMCRNWTENRCEIYLFALAGTNVGVSRRLFPDTSAYVFSFVEVLDGRDLVTKEETITHGKLGVGFFMCVSVLCLFLGGRIFKIN